VLYVSSLLKYTPSILPLLPLMPPPLHTHSSNKVCKAAEMCAHMCTLPHTQASQLAHSTSVHNPKYKPIIHHICGLCICGL
jgi:hypothetical protein